jgi:hypothetical protein
LTTSENYRTKEYCALCQHSIEGKIKDIKNEIKNQNALSISLTAIFISILGLLIKTKVI